MMQTMQWGALFPFVCLLFMAGALSQISKLRLEWTLPMCACGVICVLYGFGFLDLLRYGLYAL